MRSGVVRGAYGSVYEFVSQVGLLTPMHPLISDRKKGGGSEIVEKLSLRKGFLGECLNVISLPEVR